MRFTILPFRSFPAAANMAIDADMMARAHAREEVLFRYYGWTEQAVTIGYSQSLKAAPEDYDGTLVRIRRETGGGVVDHRQDLTYALAIPRSHPAWSDRPRNVYRALHASLCQTLGERGVAAALAPCPESCASAVGPNGVADDCFTRAEPDDVIQEPTGRKLAGAAMRRHRDALLLQGSIERSSVLPMLDESLWRKEFPGVLAAAFGCSPPVVEESWPASLPAADTVARFTSDRWNAKR